MLCFFQGEGVRRLLDDRFDDDRKRGLPYACRFFFAAGKFRTAVSSACHHQVPL